MTGPTGGRLAIAGVAAGGCATIGAACLGNGTIRLGAGAGVTATGTGVAVGATGRITAGAVPAGGGGATTAAGRGG
jgi:hypothetical protein